MTPDNVDELHKAVDGLEALGLGKEDADGLREALALAKEAGECREKESANAARGGTMTAERLDANLLWLRDAAEVGSCKANVAPFMGNVRGHIAAQGDRIAKLEAQAKADGMALYGYTVFTGPCAHGRDPWDRCDECGEETAIHALLKVRAHLERDLAKAQSERAEALRGIEEMRVTVAGLEQEKRSAIADRDRYASTSEVWRKRVHEAADALADVISGEVGRLDLVSRINELKRQRDEYRENMLKEGGKFLAEMQRADQLQDRVTRLSAAGQVLSEHVNKEPPITPEEWESLGDEGGDAVLVPLGWTARDEFAKAAMHTVIIACKGEIDEGILKFADVARRAYRLADAMVLERGRTS
jgi:hypothetical protein